VQQFIISTKESKYANFQQDEQQQKPLFLAGEQYKLNGRPK